MKKSGLFIFVALGLMLVNMLAGCSGDDGCPTCPPPGSSGGSLNTLLMHPDPEPYWYGSLWAAGPGDVFFTTNSGTIVRRSGSNWIRYNTNNPSGYNALWGTSASDIFAVGYSGETARFNGSSWTNIPTGTFAPLNAVWGTAADNVYAAGESGTLLRYDGSAWSPVLTGLQSESRNLLDIWGSSANDIWVVGIDWSSGNTGLRWHFDGTSWTETLVRDHFNTVWGFSPDTVYTGNGRGRVHQFDGTTWTDHGVELGDAVTAIWGVSTDDLWSTGYDYDLITFTNAPFVKHYDGATWSDTPGPTFDTNLPGLGGVSTNEVYTSGGANTLAMWDGSSWSYMNENRATGNALRTGWGFDTGELWAFGERGTTIYLGESASDWTDRSGFTDKRLLAAWASAPNDLYVTGEEGTIVHWNGTTWSDVAQGLTTYAIEAIWGTGPDDIWAGADAGRMLYYDGSSWTLQDVWDPSYGQVSWSVWGSGPDDYYAVMVTGVMHYDGTSWSKLELGGRRVSSVSGVSATEVYFLTNQPGPAPVSIKDGPQRIYRFPEDRNLMRFDGTSYTMVAENMEAGMHKIWATGPNSVYMFGTQTFSPVFAHYNGSGVTIKTDTGQRSLNGIFGTASGGGYALGDMGLVVRLTAQ